MKERPPMQTIDPNTADRHPIWEDKAIPDVWWGADGIDALIWADPIPYADPAADVSARDSAPLLAGDSV
jgi:hypothetical protein